MILKRTRLLLTAVSMATLWGVAISIPSAADTPDANKVVVKDFKFNPTPLTVKAGTTVTWTNQDDIPHSIVLAALGVRSKVLDTDKTFTYQFDKAGTFAYICGLHPTMHGTVVVK